MTLKQTNHSLTGTHGSLWLNPQSWCQDRTPNANGLRRFMGHPILSLFWTACPATAASLLTDTLVARGIEAFGSVEAAQEAVEHGKVLEFRDLLCFFFSVFFLLHSLNIMAQS